MNLPPPRDLEQGRPVTSPVAMDSTIVGPMTGKSRPKPIEITFADAFEENAPLRSISQSNEVYEDRVQIGNLN